ncbi:radical SAM protein [Bradyrhizobium sp. 157]|uniref:radical SAM protein n=1 Tax=Bradyrhizobium sp. 157 TaxID=2782631 RepID=UPI001FF986E8|nr:radical SAM protein [Bradyrhizobium sp. 157]MCK1640090.1 radical SAM protein [Bradyrhizobium sp. 157]
MWQPVLIVLQPTPFCNISCDYCYLRGRDNRSVMSAEVLSAIRDKVFPQISPDAAPAIIWHAGEPTVVPVSWYRQAYSELRRTAPRDASFTVQSNGIALGRDWIPFLKETGTQIGLSIDGPQAFHDSRRKTKRGKGTWSLVMQTLRELHAARIHPKVVTVLHPLSVHAVDEYFQFYRDNGITHVSFSIDEAEGCHASSSFNGKDQGQGIAEFLFGLLKRAYAEQYPLHIKEVERIASILAGGELHNEQIDAWQVLVVAANGDVTTFSPEFMEVRSPAHRNFNFGNILTDDFDRIFASTLVARTQAEIRKGVDLCRARCRYFAVCGGGAPSNKMQENGSLESAETEFCRLSVQPAAEAFRKFVHWARQRPEDHFISSPRFFAEQHA